jgi:rfaE bifunctional protein nucleotidyltransferase chain/domain
MSTIVPQTEIATSIKSHKDLKRRVVVGGCFDLLHGGHQAFLQAARKEGDALYVLLESDQAIKKIKGQDRPIQAQEERAKELSKLSYVDYIILLRGILSDKEYDELILALKPAIIATTNGDPHFHHKDRQAHLTHGRVVSVIDRLPDFSTTKIVKENSI